MASKKQNLLIGNSIYIVGHKKPDLDAVVSAYAYQQYRHTKGDFNYIGVRCDKVNNITNWAFKEFGVDLPMLMKNVAGQKIVLVDHTDPEQRPDGWQEAEIIEVLDHHRLKLETSIPPKITIRPYGSTSTLIGSKMLNSNLPVPESLAGLMVAAILDDTLALRSPITTYHDKSVAGELALISGISDLGAFAQKIFSKKDNWSKMTPKRILSTDVKNFEIGGKKIRVSQVETMNNRKLEPRSKEIIKEMGDRSKSDNIDLFLVMLTDLITNDCILLSAGPESKYVPEIFETTFEGSNKIYLPGVLSRKKQVVPKLTSYYSD